MLAKSISSSILRTILIALCARYAVGCLWSQESSKPTTSEAAPVKVSVYDEALCPGCRRFVKEQLGPTYQQIKDIMDVEIVAYGWAEETPSGPGYNFTCQHGPDECVGNKVLECANAKILDSHAFVLFTVCFMSQTSPVPPSLHAGKLCAKKVGAKWHPIKACATSLEGEVLLHEAGVKFHSLQDPEPKWVPWVLVNGNYSDDTVKDLKSTVCNAYKGPPPPACASVRLEENIAP